MIIVGSGAIGVEFAYVYNSMGTKVTIVEFLPRIVPVEDEDISRELEKQYRKQGIEIMTNASVESLDTSGALVKAKVKQLDGSFVTLEADIVLSAVGYVANIENIGLEQNGIKADKGRVIVDKFQQTSVAGIYAIGDCSPGQALAHVAAKEGINAAEHIAYQEKSTHIYRRGLIIIIFQVVRIVFLKFQVWGILKKRQRKQATKLKWVSFLSWQAEKQVQLAQPKVL